MTRFASILNPADFTGEVSIALSTNSGVTPTVETCIAETQEDILKEMMGADLYLQFGAQLPNPTSQRFIDLLNGVTYTDPYNMNDRGVYEKVDYTGLKRMLKLFTYWDYVTNQVGTNTISGMVQGGSATAKQFNSFEVGKYALPKYNLGCDLFKSARKFMNDANFSNTTSTSMINNHDGTWTATVPNTLYMEADRNIFVAGAACLVASVTSTSVKFYSSANFAQSTYITWLPFEELSGRNKHPMLMGGAI